MDALERRITSRCHKLLELPTVFSDWQQTAWCPDCDYYDCGLCGNAIHRDSIEACPFDGKVLPLREVAVETPNDQPRKLLDSDSCEVEQPHTFSWRSAFADDAEWMSGKSRARLAPGLDRGFLMDGGPTA